MYLLMVFLCHCLWSLKQAIIEGVNNLFKIDRAIKKMIEVTRAAELNIKIEVMPMSLAQAYKERYRKRNR